MKHPNVRLALATMILALTASSSLADSPKKPANHFVFSAAEMNRSNRQVKTFHEEDTSQEAMAVYGALRMLDIIDLESSKRIRASIDSGSFHFFFDSKSQVMDSSFANKKSLNPSASLYLDTGDNSALGKSLRHRGAYRVEVKSLEQTIRELKKRPSSPGSAESLKENENALKQMEEYSLTAYFPIDLVVRLGTLANPNLQKRTRLLLGAPLSPGTHPFLGPIGEVATVERITPTLEGEITFLQKFHRSVKALSLSQLESATAKQKEVYLKEISRALRVRIQKLHQK